MQNSVGGDGRNHFVWMPAFWPTSERACREGVAEAVTVSWYELGVPGGDTLYFNVLSTDSTLGGLSAERETAQREFRPMPFSFLFRPFADGCRFRDETGTAES